MGLYVLSSWNLALDFFHVRALQNGFDCTTVWSCILNQFENVVVVVLEFLKIRLYWTIVIRKFRTSLIDRNLKNLLIEFAVGIDKFCSLVKGMESSSHFQVWVELVVHSLNNFCSLCQVDHFYLFIFYKLKIYIYIFDYISNFLFLMSQIAAYKDQQYYFATRGNRGFASWTESSRLVPVEDIHLTGDDSVNYKPINPSQDHKLYFI